MRAQLHVAPDRLMRPLMEIYLDYRALFAGNSAVQWVRSEAGFRRQN